jgi:DNA-binding PadR family transcriptional regulator
MLTKLEDQILLTVWRMQGKAYGINIFQSLEAQTGKKMAVGVVYFALDRLTKKGLLESYKGEPTSVRGGMRKRYHRITESGIAALLESKKIHDSVWEGFPDTARVEP